MFLYCGTKWCIDLNPPFETEGTLEQDHQLEVTSQEEQVGLMSLPSYFLVVDYL